MDSPIVLLDICLDVKILSSHSDWTGGIGPCDKAYCQQGHLQFRTCSDVEATDGLSLVIPFKCMLQVDPLKRNFAVN